ncbi:hypothetical protein HK098_000223, partial [Nowakowskiella sp. JEL0407]
LTILRLSPVCYNLSKLNAPENYINCDSLFDEFDKVFKDSNVCNLHGFGGSGKSYTGNMYVYHAYGNGVCVAQITADTAANVPKGYSEYLKELLEKETGGKLPD